MCVFVNRRPPAIRRPASLLAVSVAALCLTLGSSAQALPMSLDAALVIADQSAPAIEAKRADGEAAAQSRISAGRLPDPKVRLGLDNFPVSGPPAGRFGADSMTAGAVSLIQDMPNGSKRQAQRARADADIDAAAAATDVQKRLVRLNTALAWMDLYFAKQRLAALSEIDRALAPMRKSAPSQLAAGASRPAETLEAQRLTAQLGDRRAELTALIGRAKAELARWTGDSDADVAGDPPDLSIDADALRAAIKDHPLLHSFDAMGRQADADRDLAVAGKTPDWSFDVGYQRRGEMWGDMVTAGVTISLPLFGSTRQDPEIAAKTQVAHRVRFEKQDAERGLAAQLDSDLADHVMHHDQWMRSRDTLVPIAKKQADLETVSFAAGDAALSQTLTALLGLAEAKIEALNREAAVKRDAVRINLTYGSNAR